MALLDTELLRTIDRVQAKQSKNATPASESEKLRRLLEHYFEDYLSLNPIFASAIGDHRYDNKFSNNISEEQRAEEKSFYAKYSRELEAINRELLNGFLNTIKKSEPVGNIAAVKIHSRDAD